MTAHCIPQNLLGEHDPVFSQHIDRDVDSIFLEIRALAKVGVAASDTNMNVDLRVSGHQELYATIGRLAIEGINRMEANFLAPSK